jgi:hypothetical protein
MESWATACIIHLFAAAHNYDNVGTYLWGIEITIPPLGGGPVGFPSVVLEAIRLGTEMVARSSATANQRRLVFTGGKFLSNMGLPRDNVLTDAVWNRSLK